MDDVVIGMATIKEREDLVKVSLKSLSNQCREIFVYLNDYEELPSWASTFRNVSFFLGKDCDGDLGDAAKFYAVTQADKYFISTDDDLEYPRDFVKTMLLWQKRFGGQAWLTTHGRVLGDESLPIRGYHQNPHPNTKLFHGLRGVYAPYQVHFGGTGSLCFDASLAKFPRDFLLGAPKNHADIWVGLHCISQKIPIFVIPHAEGWLKQQRTLSGKTIFEQKRITDEPAYLINQYLSTHNLALPKIKAQ